MARLAERFQVPVRAVHAPCLAVTQRVWDADPVVRLRRSVEAAGTLGASVRGAAPAVPLAAPLRRRVRRRDRPGRARSPASRWPWRTCSRSAAGRCARCPYSPGYDPTAVGYPHYTLDLSHTAAAGSDALAMLDRMGDRLTHVHLADGSGGPRDEHLVPGRGGQPCAEVCERLADSGFRGTVVVEVSTRRCRTRERAHRRCCTRRCCSPGCTCSPPPPGRPGDPRSFSAALSASSRSATAGSPPQLGKDWTIGPKAHGGLLMALLARAALARLAADAPGAAPDPLAVAADFLRAPDPGPVRAAHRAAAGRAHGVGGRGAAAAGRAADADRHRHRRAGCRPSRRCGRSCPSCRPSRRRDALDPAAVDAISGVGPVLRAALGPGHRRVRPRRAGSAGGPRLGPPARRADRPAVRAAGRRRAAADRVQPRRRAAAGRRRCSSPRCCGRTRRRAGCAWSRGRPRSAAAGSTRTSTVLDATGRLICQARQLALAARLPSPP